jgi:hypothetical protein
MGIPTSGDTFAQLIEYLSKAQEAAAILGHLEADNNPLKSKGWLGVSEMLKLTVRNVTKLATSKMR